MKQYINIIVITSFLLFNSCNYTAFQKVDMKTNKAVMVNIDPIISSKLDFLLASCEESTVYLNVINGDQCFTCAPVFIMVAEKLMTSSIPKENLWYIFPGMRKILQKDFMKENFGLDINNIKVMFDDEVYNYLQNQYMLNGNSNLLCLNHDKELLSKTVYQRANFSELFSVIP